MLMIYDYKAILLFSTNPFLYYNCGRKSHKMVPHPGLYHREAWRKEEGASVVGPGIKQGGDVKEELCPHSWCLLEYSLNEAEISRVEWLIWGI